jgi:hypothetical protein
MENTSANYTNITACNVLQAMPTLYICKTILVYTWFLRPLYSNKSRKKQRSSTRQLAVHNSLNE